MATLLVEDGTGALYAHEPADPLRPAVEATLAALDSLKFSPRPHSRPAPTPPASVGGPCFR